MNMSVYEWKDLPWRKIEQQVFKLQQRIFKASKRGDVRTVHRLQRLLMNSWAAKCLAVRRVTQDNQGKKTAGVDGVKSLTPQQRLDLVRTLTLDTEARPVRRVWIPKPGKDEKRPLGIPVMRDRAGQTLARLALEPEWEAVFEPNSYGFRPGRSVHDAIDAIFDSIVRKPKFVLDADIAKCFDRINQTALLQKLHTFPSLRRAIRGWLKAGIMDGKELCPSEEGTPQGGAVSPLLANIALHGLETTIREAFPEQSYVEGKRERWRPAVIRYADDFVVLHQDRSVIEQVRQVAALWLAGMGLELKPSKTRISHTLNPVEGKVGFDFLGFEVRQYHVGYHRSGKAHLGFKTIIKPSKSGQSRHLQALKDIVFRHRSAPQQGLISRLNPVIRGWAGFYSGSVAKRVFNRMDALLYAKLRRWSQRRHPLKSHTWVVSRYWHSVGERKWVFKDRDGPALVKHSDTPILRHVKVKGNASPYDGDWLYWARRLGRHPELPRWKCELLKRQDGRCAWCGLFFTDMQDLMESDHRGPKALGGADAMHNQQLLHRHCHDEKTAVDGSNHSRLSEVPVTKATDRGAG